MKTTFKYDHYFLYEELASNLKELEAKYSSIMKVESIGITPKNRHVFAVTLSNGDASKKPAYYNHFFLYFLGLEPPFARRPKIYPNLAQ